jgi:hypothetical protein
MDSDKQPLDLLRMEGKTLIPPKKIIVSAGAGIISMISAILLLAGLTGNDKQPAIVIPAILLIVALGLIIPIWMFIRSVLLLLKKQSLGAPTRTFAIFFTILLGFILLLLFIAFLLYAREDRQRPF